MMHRNNKMEMESCDNSFVIVVDIVVVDIVVVVVDIVVLVVEWYDTGMVLYGMVL